jgi:hypothetical protein
VKGTRKYREDKLNNKENRRKTGRKVRREMQKYSRISRFRSGEDSFAEDSFEEERNFADEHLFGGAVALCSGSTTTTIRPAQTHSAAIGAPDTDTSVPTVQRGRDTRN